MNNCLDSCLNSIFVGQMKSRKNTVFMIDIGIWKSLTIDAVCKVTYSINDFMLLYHSKECAYADKSKNLNFSVS